MSRVHGALGFAAAILGLAAAIADGRPTVAGAATPAGVAAADLITAPDLAARIMNQDPSLVVVDLRPTPAYDELHIPTAISVAPERVAEQSFPPAAAIVLYAEGSAEAASALALLRQRGHRDARIVREGIYEWLARVLEPRLASDATAAEREAFARAEVQSRFFGGQPRSSVSRAEVPTGYWTEPMAPGAAGGWRSGSTTRRSTAEAIRATVGTIRRRGC